MEETLDTVILTSDQEDHEVEINRVDTDRIIVLKSRKSPKILKFLHHSDGTLSTKMTMLDVDTDLIRVEFIDDQMVIILDGGPSIKVGDVIQDKIIKYIHLDTSMTRYLIEFE